MFQVPCLFRSGVTDKRQIRRNRPAGAMDPVTTRTAEPGIEGLPSRHRRIDTRNSIQIPDRQTQEGQHHNQKHNTCAKRDRPSDRIPGRIAINKRPQQHNQNHSHRKDPGRQRLQRPMDVLQQLVIEEEIPLRHRHKTRVGRIGLVGQRERHQQGKTRNDREHHQHHNGIHVDLPRIKRLAAE